MKVEYVEETSVRKALEFEIEPEVLEKEVEQRAREYARRVKLPGFRPGKVPADVIRRRFRAQVLEDAAEAIVNRVVFEELEGRGLKPLASPRVTDLKMEEDRPMTFRAVFETLPLVEVPDYRGLQVKARRAEVSDEDVERELDRLREEAARYDPVEGRAAQRGDFVVADVERRTAEDEPARDDHVLIEVGGEENYPELNAELEGSEPGQTREVRVVREDAEAPLGARTIEYTVQVKAIKRKVVPPADDEFAKDLGEFDSLDALRERVRTDMQAEADDASTRQMRQDLLRQLGERVTFELPPSLVEREVDRRVEEFARQLIQQRIDPRQAGIDWAEFREAQREAARASVASALVLDEIVRREHLTVAPEDVDKEIEKFAVRAGRTPTALRAQLEKEGGLGRLAAGLRREKAVDLALSRAKMTSESRQGVDA